MKVETPGNSNGSGTTAPTPDNISIADDATDEIPEGSLTAQSSSASITSTSSKGKQKLKDQKISEDSMKTKKEETKSNNLMGKINNLVTTDLGNIVEARDFLLVSEYN
jgi:hypothetical protein